MIQKQQAASGKATNRKGKTPKKIIALQYLLARSLNQLEALRLFNDTCFNSTISELSNKHGLCFNRVSEPHNHQGGGVTHFMRYTLADESQVAAKVLISSYPPVPYEVAA